MTRIKQSIAFIGLILLLTACSPHPGSGIWETLGENESGLSKLAVHFDGRVEMFAQDKPDAVIRCFWVGKDKENLSMDCVTADNLESKSKYSLRINAAENETADLLKSEILVGAFKRVSRNPGR